VPIDFLRLKNTVSNEYELNFTLQDTDRDAVQKPDINSSTDVMLERQDHVRERSVLVDSQNCQRHFHGQAFDGFHDTDFADTKRKLHYSSIFESNNFLNV